MKYLILILAMNLGCALLAHAEHCSIDGHAAELEAAYESAIRDVLLKSKMPFAIDPESIELKSHTEKTFEDGENFPRPLLGITGSVRSASGTKFTILAQSAKFFQSLESGVIENELQEGSMGFATQLLSRGTDHQGNPIQPQCRLSTKSEFALVNEPWHRVVAKFTLPSTLTVNLE